MIRKITNTPKNTMRLFTLLLTCTYLTYTPSCTAMRCYSHNFASSTPTLQHVCQALPDALCVACIEEDAHRTSSTSCSIISLQITPQKNPQELLAAARRGDFSKLPKTKQEWQKFGLDINMSRTQEELLKESCQAQASANRHNSKTDPTIGRNPSIYEQENSPFRVPELDQAYQKQRESRYSVDAGKTFLHYAAQFGDTKTVKTLLSAGANPHKKTANGATPLLYAIRADATDITNLILTKTEGNNKKSINPDLLSAYIITGMTSSNEKTIKAILDFGATINYSGNKTKTTPLHSAAAQDNAAATELLLQKGADPKALDAQQRTPLIIACGTVPGNYAAAKKIISSQQFCAEHKKIINQSDNRGKTALHWAERQKNGPLVKLLTKQEEPTPQLIHHGADTKIKNHQGDLTGDIAEKMSDQSTPLCLNNKRGAEKTEEKIMNIKKSRPESV